MPLQRRVPKFGFNNPNKVVYKPINLEQLQKLVDQYKPDVVDPEFLAAHGQISKKERVKILGKGALTSGVQVKAHAFSGTARTAIEQAGGSATQL